MKFSEYNVVVEDGNTFYVCNTFTGAVFEIDEDLARNINAKDLSKLSDVDIAQFTKGGVVIDDRLDEYSTLLYQHNLSKYHPSILSLTILLTSDCNFRCTYCFEGLDKPQIYLSDEVKDGIFNFVNTTLCSDLSIRGVAVTLFGGEPLMHFEQSYDFLHRLKELCAELNRGFKTDLVTNGSLINQNRLEMLKELNCSSIQITLDGIPEVHNIRRVGQNGASTFDSVIAGIKKVCAYPHLKNPVIRINVDRTNVETTFELLEYLFSEHLNCCYIDFGIVRDANQILSCSDVCFADEELGDVLSPLWRKLVELEFPTSFTPSRRPLYCGLCSNLAYTIDANGDVFKCWEMVGDEKYRVGRLTKDGRIVNLSNHFFEWMNRSIENIDGCRDCRYLPLCGGGCASVSLQQYGTLYGKGCFKTKSILEQQLIFKYASGKQV